ncbi:aldo/keto reductase [Glycomyces artemisiae]|uniref:Aryl-alcohol dehydrogenase-like predicted oxidoreductase n=1 Tax=Glycomyces artemisiae TaxID=1076443 RepID=A0A2T0UPR2_9ACTN|nr:aldo/keto reductase [Glycomyces artemisiae]PRY59915.1 aryl-alcohol dehydrogenase-like predicted oxidoreductase [Glycomyces artemisiae]
MQLRRLGRTGRELSPIGLGCMQFSNTGAAGRFYRATAQDTATAIVRAALDGGVTWFDTAEMYGGGHSERALTTALREHGVKPGEVAIATKWQPVGRTARSIPATIGDRLAALQDFPIDLHQIHMPHGSLSSIPAQVKAMARLQTDGKVGAVGVSNFSAAQMRRAAAVLDAEGLALASNQIQLNLLHRNAETDGVLAAARDLGVTLIAFSPLRSGLLTGKFHDDPERLKQVLPIRRWIGGFGPRAVERTRPLIDELTAIGRAHGASPSQIALAWLLAYYGDTVVAIPGASRPEQAAELAAAAELRLTDAETAALDARSREATASR